MLKQSIKPISTIIFILIIVLALQMSTVSIAWSYQDPVEGFVSRLYQLTLDREPDSQGLKFWVNELKTGKRTGANVSTNFIFSKEFKDKNLDNQRFLEIMYSAFFDRKPDAGGLLFWHKKLDQGYSRMYILANFIGSREFRDICSEYSINPGKVTLSTSDRTPAYLAKEPVSFTNANTGVNLYIDMSEAYLLYQLGQPARKDSSEEGFTWYIYNKDYRNYVQAGISGKKVVALYSISNSWVFNGDLKVGTKSDNVAKQYGSAYEIVLNNARVDIGYDKHAGDTILDLWIKKTSGAGGKSNYTAKTLMDLSYQIFDISNAFRVRMGKKALLWDEKMHMAAKLHSEDMAANDYFSHESLDGRTFFDRLQEQADGLSSGGENIAAGYRNAIEACRGWINSSGHRQNLLHDFDYLGVGTAYDIGSTYSIYYTQNFCSYWD